MKAKVIFRRSMLCLGLGIGAMALCLPTPALASFVDQCEQEMEQAYQKTRERLEKEAKTSPIYDDVEQDRMSALDCQMSISAELSSWVKGNSSMSFLDDMFDQLSGEMTKQACDELKARARKANQELSKLDDLVKDLPESVEEAKRLAQEVADRHAREYAQQKVDEYMKQLPPPSSYNTPGYTNPFTGQQSQQTWDQLRELWGATR